MQLKIKLVLWTRNVDKALPECKKKKVREKDDRYMDWRSNMRIWSADKQEIISSEREQHNKNNLACMCAHLNVPSTTSFIGNQWKATSRCVLAKKKKSFKYKNIIKASSHHTYVSIKEQNSDFLLLCSCKCQTIVVEFWEKMVTWELRVRFPYISHGKAVERHSDTISRSSERYTKLPTSHGKTFKHCFPLKLCNEKGRGWLPWRLKL